MGAKPKPIIDYAEVERLAGQGLTQLQICHCIGIAERTMYRYKKDVTQFRQAIERGQAKAIAEVTNALFENAKAGDVSAQKYYLNNRSNQSWKDKQELEHSGEFTHTITVVDTGTGNVGPSTEEAS